MKKSRINKSRSRSGCLTCRQRHIKCDEGSPVCNNCRRSNRSCERSCRFNFLKSITFTPHTPEEVDYSNVTFMDHSLTIHRLYRCGSFHDYSQWLQEHSRQELKESDADIRYGERANDTPAKRNIKPRSHTVSSNENSDSEMSRQSPGTPAPFNTFDFVAKVLSIPKLPNGEHNSLFVYNHYEPLINMIGGDVQMAPVVDDKVTLIEVMHFLEKLERFALYDSFGQETFQLEYAVLLNSLNLLMKTGVIDVFSQTFASSNIISGLYQILNIDNWASNSDMLMLYESVHNYGNLMNVYELMLLDLNESLKYGKPNSIRTDDETIAFMFEKVLSLNLFDDLNYILIRMTIILLRLNNLRHHRHKNHNDLTEIIKDLKDLESNQFFTAYYPQVHDGSSFSSNSSFESINGRPSTMHNSGLVFANMKARRTHLYYTFTICYLLKHFPLTNNVRSLLFAPTFLNTFWNHQDLDPFQRLSRISQDVDFNSDPFMSFLSF